MNQLHKSEEVIGTSVGALLPCLDVSPGTTVAIENKSSEHEEAL
jgi:hypothetical protein